ncbi:hypothetical protein SUGI_0455590 [Cryptomeria japonica]|uniref:pentatricopeptide repeat-containing protein At3g18110, chloroplastic n=1 Tax=Cryptomeria japonica TaxID=3369 RepID=UPI002408ED06|nr:pentatricopeptide repeat-containing protein At3g18110, chloroplastic [Cryptomeria japonica]GLJ23966.1 hypothetical protein SUGI_0455590 [Cryptomeria japonica]
MLAVCIFPARGVHSGAPSPPKQVCYSNSLSNNASATSSSSPQQFKYSRASPSVRWPHLNREDDPVDLFSLPSTQIPPEQNGRISRKEHKNHLEREQGCSKSSNLKNIESTNVKIRTNEDTNLEQQEGSIPPNLAHNQDIMDEKSILESKRLAKRQAQVAIKRATDWQSRVHRLSNAICKLHSDRLVADVLENSRIEQLSPLDYCYVVKRVGQTHWKRALEIYEWLNFWHLYTPNPRMLATILGVLGRANQIVFAEEIFQRAEPKVGNCVQVYNAMMGVYARHGSCERVQELLNLMRSRDCVPDLVTFNILINARTKAGYMGNGSAIGLLREVKNAGLRPDIITYNTLISSCAAGGSALEGEEVFKDMEQSGCEPDLWTYNAMISVYGRSGNDEEAGELLDAIKRRGFCPDAVTYNALLYAFARNGKVEKVDSVRMQMASAGFRADEITYNTMIHMYGKKGMHENALLLYKEMTTSGCRPDAVTFTVLVDSLGKAGFIMEAAQVFSEMSEARVKPTLRTFSALICGYAKAGMLGEAEETYDCMIKTGIGPDCLAYSVILGVLQKANKIEKALTLCENIVQEGLKPDPSLYESMLQIYMIEDDQEGVKKLTEYMEASSLDPSTVCSILVKAKCNEQAANVLKSAVVQGYSPGRENSLSILDVYRLSNRYNDARAFVNFISDIGTKSITSITVIHEALIIMLAEAAQVEAAREEFEKLSIYCPVVGASVYEALIIAYEQSELLAEASQLYSDFRFYGLQATFDICRSMAMTYCKMGFPETADNLVGCTLQSGMILEDYSVYAALIEAYGKQNMWQNAEEIFGQLQLSNLPINGKVWNALIYAYAQSGQHKQARIAFDQMLKNGLSPTVDTVNGLMQALINGERLEHMQILVEELQQIGFRISKSTISLMFNAFAKVGNIPEVKRIYSDMKAAGYSPNMQLYRTFIKLLSKREQVRDAELIVADMEAAGFKPDVGIYNSMLHLYTCTGHFKKAVEVYQHMQAAGCDLDGNTYSILISMYSRHLRTGEAFAILKEMKRYGHMPTLNAFKELLSVCGRQQLWEETEKLFGEMQNSCKLDREAYHVMIKAYRYAGEHKKAENLLAEMRNSGIEPTLATMHMLMDSYGKGGEPEKAENVLKDLYDSGLNLGTAQYNTVVNAYLKIGDHAMAIEKLMKMRADGFEPDCRTWTCIIGAASMCKSTSETLYLLRTLGDVGFTLPIRLLTENSDKLISEVDILLEEMKVLEDEVGFGFVNVIEDLLWAFEQRATAAWIFQMAVQKKIYPQDVLRVENKDWRADFRRLSAGAALVGLTLWMDHMQDASLQGVPECSKSVVLVTGSSIYSNAISVNKTLKAFLWEMGSPFYPSKLHTGIFVAKGHALCMWLKDSPFCMDLELKNCQSLPEYNSMDIYEGSLMRSEMVSPFRQINEQLGKVTPKKFSRLALMPDEKREKAISAELKGRKEVLEKRKGSIRLKRGRKFNLKQRARE